MTDDGRLRSALTALAEGEPVAPVPIDLDALERARRSRWLVGATVSAVVVAGVGTFVVQTGVLGVGGGEVGTGIEVVDQPGDDALPRMATVRCTESGTVVEPTRIAAASDGIHLEVANESSDFGAYLTYESLGTEGPATEFPDFVAGGDHVPATPTEWVRTYPPGAYEFSCAHGPEMTNDAPVTLVVVDPDGYYEEIDAEAVLGCPFTGMVDGPGAEGPTGRTAVDTWVSTYAPGGVVTLASGYRDDPNRSYLLDSENQRAELGVSPLDDGTFSAGMGAICT